MTDSHLIDHTIIKKLASDIGMPPEEVIPFLLDSLEDDVQQSFSEMEAAIQANDIERLKRAAHKMKGGCKTLGAVAAVSDAEELETLNDTEVTDKIIAMVISLKSIWGESMVALQKLSL